MQDETFRLVEECTGVGRVEVGNDAFAGIRYAVKRFQAVMPSGLPVPGLHRIEGTVLLEDIPERDKLVDSALTLRMEDGRSLRLTLASSDGRVLAEGHGPSSCGCC